MERFILIPHLPKLLNMTVEHGFPKLWTQILIVHIFKSGDKKSPSNYMNIMISHILAKLYGLILERNTSLWLENHGKRANGKVGFRRHHPNTILLSPLGSFPRSFTIVKPISSIVLLTLEKLSTPLLEITPGTDLKRYWFPLSWGLLWFLFMRLLFPSLSSMKGSLKTVNEISGLRKSVLYLPPFLAFTSIS